MKTAEWPLGGTVCIAYWQSCKAFKSHTLYSVERLWRARQHESECAWRGAGTQCTSVTGGACSSFQVWYEFDSTLFHPPCLPISFTLLHLACSEWVCPQTSSATWAPSLSSRGHSSPQRICDMFIMTAEAADLSLYFAQQVLRSRAAHGDIDIPWLHGQLVAIGAPASLVCLACSRKLWYDSNTIS